MTNKERVENAVLSVQTHNGVCDVVPVSLAFELIKELEEAQRQAKAHQDIKEAEKKILIEEIQKRNALEVELGVFLDFLCNRYIFGKVSVEEEALLRKHKRIV